MDLAITSILLSPSHHDYSELFYRYDFLKNYELNIHEIAKMPDDDVFYLQQVDEHKKERFNKIIETIYPNDTEGFKWRYRYF